MKGPSDIFCGKSLFSNQDISPFAQRFHCGNEIRYGAQSMHLSNSHVSIKAGASQSVMVILKIWNGFLNISSEMKKRENRKKKKKKMLTEMAIKFFETGQFSRVDREGANKHLFCFGLMAL